MVFCVSSDRNIGIPRAGLHMFLLWGSLQVAPSCAIESGCTGIVEQALSSACDSRVYHPEAAEGERRAPYLALWHEEGTARYNRLLLCVPNSTRDYLGSNHCSA